MIFILFTLFISSFVGAELPMPPYAKSCARTDPNFGECARKSGQYAIPFIAKGDKKYSIPPMDPLYVPHIETSAGDRNTPTKLNLALSELQVHGLGDATIQEIKQDFENMKIQWRIITPKVTAYGKYNVSGQVLVVPIRGDGDFNVTFTDMSLNMNITYTVGPKHGGKNYMTIQESNLGYTISRFRGYLDNLFNGNKELGTEVNNFLNENWEDTANAIGPLIAEAFNQVFKSILDGLTDKIPYDVIFPEKV